MRTKLQSYLYWTTTLLFAFLSFFGGVTELLHTEQAQEGIRALGYPLYFLTILGTAKILGALALVYTRWSTLTEWAYAGFTFDILGASASIWLNGDGLGMALIPLIFLVVLGSSYILWKK